MKINEIPLSLRYEYSKICDVCEMKQTILTQSSNFPEYKAEIYLQCSCGNYIEFNLNKG
jgi:hypothetical protein